MTLERASEIIGFIRDTNSRLAIDLFMHFVDHFDLRDEQLSYFARMCGFPVACNATIIREVYEE